MFSRTQAPVLQSRLKNQDELCAQTYIDGVRVYTSFSTVERYVSHLLSETPESHCSAELLWGPVHTYFDIDCEQTLSELGWKNMPEFIAKFNDLLLTCYEKYLGIIIPIDCIHWSECCREKKTSFHVVVENSEYFWAPVQVNRELKEFVNIVADETRKIQGLSYLKEHNGEIQMSSCIDICVYHNNRCMRSVFCSKRDGGKPLFPINHNAEPLEKTYNVILKNLITSPIENKKPFILKKRRDVPPRTKKLTRALVDKLAEQYGCRVNRVRGKLVELRNAGKERVCPLTPGCVNLSDNAYFIRQNDAIFYGCHSECCQGKLKKIHQFESVFKHYDDYNVILDLPADKRNRELIEDFLTKTVKLIDRPEKAMFITTRQTRLDDLPLDSQETVCSNSLFSKNNDVFIKIDGKRLRFSDVLSDLVQTRSIPVYTHTVWTPFTKKSPFPRPNLGGKYNIFSGFALDRDVPSEVQFENTNIYKLISTLTNHEPESLKYLLDFLAYKTQKPYHKLPILNAFLSTPKGCGKGTFALFLKKLFSCNEQVLVSYNKISQLASNFNSELRTALFVILEEVTAGKYNSIKEFTGLLKDLTSMESILIERKGMDREPNCPFYGNFFVFSNEMNVLQITDDNRRIVCYNVDGSRSNDNAFFSSIYTELSSLEVMQSAFDFFCTRDISTFDYRKIPQTTMIEKLKRCSESIERRFARWFWKTYCRNGKDYVYDDELYIAYSEFCNEQGIPNKRDVMYVGACFENVVDCFRDGEGFKLRYKAFKKLGVK